MKTKDKIELLYKRHIKIVIEWGGVKNMFSSCSDMSVEGATKLLKALNGKDKKIIQKKITKIVFEENEAE
jgi:hypothetical protein